MAASVAVVIWSAFPLGPAMANGGHPRLATAVRWHGNVGEAAVADRGAPVLLRWTLA